MESVPEFYWVLRTCFGRSPPSESRGQRFEFSHHPAHSIKPLRHVGPSLTFPGGIKKEFRPTAFTSPSPVRKYYHLVKTDSKSRTAIRLALIRIGWMLVIAGISYTVGGLLGFVPLELESGSLTHIRVPTGLAVLGCLICVFSYGDD